MKFFEDLIIVADPNLFTRTGAYGCWHSDWFTFGNVIEPEFAYSVWLPLADTNEEKGGSLQICNRSTRLQLPKNCSSGVNPGAPVFACLKGQTSDPRW